MVLVTFMVFIMIFGVLMMLLSLQMIKSPQIFSSGIAWFSQQAYFHVFEILSRLFFGLIFIYYASQTSAVMVNTVLGYLMLFTSMFLLIIGSNKHRTFACWSATTFCSTFRMAGVFSFGFGAYIVYSTIS